MNEAKKQTIVLIEDEEVLTKLLVRKLEDCGYAVAHAGDGPAGLELIDRTQPALVLLDMKLPQMSGMRVLERLHEEGKLPALPVVVISNSGQPVEVDEAKRLGVRDYLVKLNFNPEEVMDKVHQALRDADDASGGSAPSANGSRKRAILIVEDDLFIADLLGRKLHDFFSVFQAADAEHARKILQEETIDLVCLDIILPGIDGYTFLEEIKSNPELKHIPVLILSNLGQREEIERGINAGASDYLVKANMSPEEISDHVKRLLNEDR